METVVLLFTDVEGSTRAWATSPDMVNSLERHDLVLRDAFARNRGVEFKHTGDGLCATFPSVSDAVDAAADLQRTLAAADWADGPVLNVRVAVHAGPAHRRGDDWFGLSLSRCARLLAVAHGGQVLVSSTAAAMLQDAPAPGFELVDRGRVALKDFPQPEQVWQLVGRDLRTDFPPLRSATTAGNVPADLSSLVGRSKEIEHLCAALRRSRLVTLAGPGGVGKTRLALAAARELSAEMTGGAWLVELAGAQTSDDVDNLVAASLGFVPRVGTSPRDSIIEGVGARQLLLVLDNCEHLVNGVAAFAVEVLGQCESLAILATSREPLGTTSEVVFGVPSLEVESDAVDLFVDRATAVDADFVAEPREAIEDICRRLDGIPLAIELAAAGVRTLRVAEIGERLRDHLDVVTAGRRRIVERHATVRAAIDWSWSLLDDQEREAFARLSVFAGRFDLAAATAVVATNGASDSIDVVAALVDKSMIVVDRSSVAPFRLLEPLRQYGAERLGETGQVEEAARAHAEHYAERIDVLANRFETTDEIAAAREIGAARDNLRAAFAFAAVQGDADLAIRLVVPLAQYSTVHVWPEPWAWCDTALGMPDASSHPLRRGLLQHASLGAWQLGEQDRSLALADEALALAGDDLLARREAQGLRAYALVFLGRFAEAEAAAAEGVGELSDVGSTVGVRRLCTLQLIRAITQGPNEDDARTILELADAASPSVHALALHTAGMIYTSVDPRRALALQEAAAELATETGAELVLGFALVALASIEAEHDPAGGVRRFTDLMAHYLRVGNRTHLREFARGAVSPLARCDEWEAAATVEGATRASALFRSTIAEPVADAEAKSRAALGKHYDDAADRGAAMTDDELVTFMQAVAAGLPRSA